MLIEFGHEMNGNWYAWGQKPTAYIKAFQTMSQAIYKVLESQNPNVQYLAIQDHCTSALNVSTPQVTYLLLYAFTRFLTFLFPIMHIYLHLCICKA